MEPSDRRALLAFLAAGAAALLLTDLRVVWASPQRGWFAPWVLWAGFVAAGGIAAGLAPRDDV